MRRMVVVGTATLLTALGYRVSVNMAGVHEAGPDVATLRSSVSESAE